MGRFERTYRHKRVRSKVVGTAQRPRLCVFKSNNFIYTQIIDDTTASTLVQASTFEKAVQQQVEARSFVGIASAKILGSILSQRAKEKNIEQVVFDRGGYQYHGVVKALADSVREGGLKF